MPAQAGRALLVEYSADGGTTYTDAFLGQTTGTITVNREPIDITSKEDDGIRTLLADLGTFSVDIGFEGIVKTVAFAALLFEDAPTSLYDFRVTVGDLFTVTGDFFIAGGEIGGEDGANAITYSGTLNSSGPVTYAET